MIDKLLPKDLAQISANMLNGEPVKPEWILAQWKHETANFTSELAIKYHNYGGLTQSYPNNLQQPDGNMYYMEFSNPYSFALYFGRYLRYYGTDGIYAVKTLEDYIFVLKSGGYFGDTYENYLKGVQSYA